MGDKGRCSKLYEEWSYMQWWDVSQVSATATITNERNLLWEGLMKEAMVDRSSMKIKMINTKINNIYNYNIWQEKRQLTDLSKLYGLNLRIGYSKSLLATWVMLYYGGRKCNWCVSSISAGWAMLYQTCEKSSWCQQKNEIWAVLCCINRAKKWIDANKNHHCVARDVGIREEICLIDANIGLVLPSHQLEKTRKWYSMVGEEQFRQGTRRGGNGGHT